MYPNAAFFESLGKYVYGYKSIDDKWDYVGKGVGDRCLHHLKEKDVSYEDCHIIARNLEVFEENKNDGVQFAVESATIEVLTILNNRPSMNKVSGHYKEKFPMVALSTLYAQYVSEQHDNFADMPAWYYDAYSQYFERKVNKITVTNDKFEVCSPTRKGVSVTLYVPANATLETEVRLILDFNSKTVTDNDTCRQELSKWLQLNGVKEITSESTTKISSRLSLQKALEVWGEYR